MSAFKITWVKLTLIVSFFAALSVASIFLYPSASSSNAKLTDDCAQLEQRSTSSKQPDCLALGHVQSTAASQSNSKGLPSGRSFSLHYLDILEWLTSRSPTRQDTPKRRGSNSTAW
jgi:hypothetical protein